MITKTEFMLYLESPIHFWAHRHGQTETTEPAPYETHILQQAMQVEHMAEKYLREMILPEYEQAEMVWQPTYDDGAFLSRADAVIFDIRHQTYDIYEIKCITRPGKEHNYDATFQTLIYEKKFALRHTYLLYLDKEYTFDHRVDHTNLFTVVNIDEQINECRHEIERQRNDALQVDCMPDAGQLDRCLKPARCPCPQLCHPDLPDYSIYDIPRLHATKARKLKEAGIERLDSVPDDFPLSDRQKPYVDAVKNGQPLIDGKAIRDELATLVYPLHFLDYETYNPAIPWYDGYHPFQHMVFQYSLHVLDEPSATLQHFEYVVQEKQEPAGLLLEHLSRSMQDVGTVLVWNKAFETARNREMGMMFPAYRDFLEQVNGRIFDLMEIFSRGLYVHADFHGSASIKYVLPVLAPHLSYQEMNITRGDEAMLAWYRLMTEDLTEEEKRQRVSDLLNYCRLDTLAMVEIFNVINQM